MVDKLQYWPVALFVRLIGMLPRPLAHAVGMMIGGAVYLLHPRLRRVGLRNLELAFPNKSIAERRRILRGVYVSLGRLLGEACQFPKYTRENAGEIAVYQGFENFQEAESRGRGVLLLTGHFGGWEVGSFFHSLQGHPMQIVVRPLDNPYVDALVQRYRGLHGNSMIGKQEFARGLIAAMRARTYRRHPDGYEHDAAARCVRRLLRHSCLHRERRGASRAAYGRSSGSCVHHLGSGAA